jgi:coenzyme F420-reducing hydrogenase delta subunit
MVYRNLMDFMGIDIERITFSWVSAAEGAKWAELVNEVTTGIRAKGPYTEYQELAHAGVE